MTALLEHNLDFICAEHLQLQKLLNHWLKLGMLCRCIITINRWYLFSYINISLQDGNIAILLAESQDKLERFLINLNYRGDALIAS